jgi:hypothetical protein
VTNIDLIDWTLQEAQQLRNEEARYPEAPSSLSKLLSVLEGDHMGPRQNEPAAQVISFPHQSAPADHTTAGEPNAIEERHLPDLPVVAAVEEPRLETLPATKSALLMAIIEPTIYTEQVYRERAIALRWTLRDIKANRLNWSPISQDDLQTLIDLGLVEISRDEPVLTNAGLRSAI